MSKKIFLIGLPGAGKTTMGIDLARHMGIGFIDLDQKIEQESKQNISSIFKEYGEDHFRHLEKLHLKKAPEVISEFVMATGGGTPCFFDNSEFMKKNGVIIFIDTPIEIIRERIRYDTTRPLIRLHTLESLYEKRKEWYQKATFSIQEYDELIHLVDQIKFTPAL